ncbi:MAG: RNase adapter RapZ [Candidatus Eremiobacteraeota bacterium]|nr:RNase adapter RapZ [Candidatus Eremiobacteraeota bacterium]
MFSRFVIVTGCSGAGKSQAMKSLEDAGFSCVDNLPPALAGELVSLAERQGVDRLALSFDVRTGGAFGDARASLDQFAQRGLAVDLLFLDAGDEAIVRRYSETRRRHPSAGAESLADAIARERRALEPLRARATEVWDTTTFTLQNLKTRLLAAYGGPAAATHLAVHVVAFGFKYGLPLDADLLFDVRFFPNPNYVAELKERTGLEREVIAYMDALSETEPFLARVTDLVDFLIPLYRREGKSRLTIAIGCTGGRHRSVYIAERLAAHLVAGGVTVVRELRELVAA